MSCVNNTVKDPYGIQCASAPVVRRWFVAHRVAASAPKPLFRELGDGALACALKMIFNGIRRGALRGHS